MRRLVFPAIAAIGLVMVGPSSAFADDPAPVVSVKATPGKKICKVVDPKLDEISGIVATKNGFVVIDDSTKESTHKRVFYLNNKCEIVDDVQYSGAGPRDTEDLVLSPDGKTLWIADIGDNNYKKDDGSRRETIVIWKMPLDRSSKPKLYRMAYPQGDYHDAEALLLSGTGGGTPLIVTRESEAGKPAYIYQPTAALTAGSETGVPLKRVGTLTVSATETPAGPLGRIGNRIIDGGAVAPGGTKVVLRTYTDALEWDVTGGNVLAALKNKPRTTALPNEPSGEAITYSPDGKFFYTVSDINGIEDTANYIQQYTPATTVAAVKKAAAGGAAGGSGAAWYSDLTINQITLMVGAVGVIGLVLVGIGVYGIREHRRRLRDTPAFDDDDVDDLPGDPATELIGVGGAPQRPVYGGARSGPPAGGGGVYGGAKPAPAPAGGPPRGGAGVYGGGPQYARPQGGQGQPRPQGGQGQPRPPAGGQPRGPVYGGGGGGASGGGGGGPQYGQPRGPQPGQRPQRPQGGQGGGPAQGGQRPQGPQGGGGGGQPRGAQGPRSQGTYGQQQGGRPDGGRPPQRDGHADRNGRPDGRFDNPGYRR